ncbi:MAG: hypothetical protein ACRCVN_07225 [Spirochaetia bacterium]
MRKNLSYALDNVGLIYPAIVRKNNTTLFRLSAQIKESTRVSILQRALENILPRFPIFRTQVKSGIFWPYLEENFVLPRLSADETPCQNYRVDRAGHYPFRIVVHANCISLETSHIITDGYGAMIFFQSLLGEYFFLLGKIDRRLDSIIHPHTVFNKEEVSDAYKRHGDATLSSSNPRRRTGYAFIEPARRIMSPFLKIIRIKVAVEDVKKMAKACQVTVTEWLLALYFSAYQDMMFTYPPKEIYRRPIRITTPVDLRNFFPTKTLRNFIALLSLEINPCLGVFSFDEILHEVHYAMRRELVAKHFQPFIGASVRNANRGLIASVPLFIKKPIVRMIHKDAMKRETSVLSNLGQIQLSDQLENCIDLLAFVPAPKWTNKRDCSVLSYKDDLVISFSRVVKNDLVEHFFYQRLLDFGLKPHVKEANS